MKAILFIWYLFIVAFVGVSSAVYEDCENPPAVAHANYEIHDTNDVYKALYECVTGYELKGSAELICDLDTDEWQGTPPTCTAGSNEVASDTDNNVERRKQKLSIPEEPNVTPNMAQILDLSCIQAKVKAPEISHGTVQKYERRRKGEKVFLVAYYACNENYEFEDSEINALYCRAKQWVGEIPNCMPSGEYNEEDEDEEPEYDEYETVDKNDDDFKEDDDGVPPPALPVPAAGTAKQPKDDVEQIDVTEPEPDVVLNVENEVATSTNPGLEATLQSQDVTDINIVVGPTQDPYTPRLLDEECGEDNAGCTQRCQRLLYPGENEPRTKCSCYDGFTLDPNNYATCHDVDECQEHNGGCAQICHNLAGSFECGCEQGYHIDPSTGNTCVDIDECKQPDLAAQCPNGCENTPGSYQCIEALDTATVTTTEAVREVNELTTAAPIECGPGYRQVEQGKCSDIDECAEFTNECEHFCINTQGSYTCECSTGYELANDGKNCVDINECEIVGDAGDDLTVSQKVCSHMCENIPGSFVCACGQDFHLLDDRRTCAPDTCQDLDKPFLNKTRCAHQCLDLPNGRYECVCPKGYQLDADLHSCIVKEDICILGDGQDRCRPGICHSVDKQFVCSCPPGYSDDAYSCNDIDECATGAHKCQYTCLNTEGGYECQCPQDMLLAADGYTCVPNDPCAVNNNGCEQICQKANGGACACESGYQLSPDGKSCEDIDECQSSNGGCQQLCRNTPGSFACGCDAGYELAEDQRTCVDVDECYLEKHYCSHECINKAGGYECACPAGYELDYSGQNCLYSSKCLSRLDCSHSCKRIAGVDTCECPEGLMLDESAIACIPKHVECPPGFNSTSDGRGCAPVPCSLNNGGCSHACDNTLGCDCPLGLTLGPDGKTCQDIDECQLNNGGCSHTCENTFGSFECSCPAGLYLVGNKDCIADCKPGYRRSLLDTTQCVDIDECSTPGICQYKCLNQPGSYQCTCPRGYRLENNKNCIDIDECEDENGGCIGGTCINQKGSYQCKCPADQQLGSDRRTCVYRTEQRDQCSAFKAPANGAVRCHKYRHKKKRFYNTKCRIWCNAGYELQGPAERHCDANGRWDAHTTVCLPRKVKAPPALCPRLPVPQNGVIYPAACMQRDSNMGVSCHLQCHPGYAPIGAILTSCMPLLGWSLTGSFDCRPFGANIFSNQIPQQLKANWQPALNVLKQVPIKSAAPYIKCPQNALIVLNEGQLKAHVILQRPESNVDARFIDAFPAWAKNLQAHLPVGSYDVIFSARDPITGKSANCRTNINIQHSSPVDQRTDKAIATNLIGSTSFCTPSFEVYLRENQHLRSVVWEEPRFEGELIKLYKSHFPGALFSIGEHPIHYEATSRDGVTMRCSFKIHVKAAVATTTAAPAQLKLNTIDSLTHLPVISLVPGHESYVVCPGQQPVRVTAKQSVNLPVGCSLKNVRKAGYHRREALKRGLLTSRWHQA